MRAIFPARAIKSPQPASTTPVPLTGDDEQGFFLAFPLALGTDGNSYGVGEYRPGLYDFYKLSPSGALTIL